MKWGSRGACAALSSCLLLACALSAAAVGLKCFSLGSELKGEPFRLGSAAGAFYSGLLLAAGLALLGSALFCCRQRGEEGPASGDPQPPPPPPQGNEVAAVPVSGDGPLPVAPKAASPGGRQNFLLLGVLVFMLGVLSAFAGAVIDGDTVSLVEKKYSHYCLLPQSGAAAAAGSSSSSSSSSSLPSGPRGRPSSSGSSSSDGSFSSVALRCQKLRDYQRGLVLSTIFNALECLLGLLNLLLVKNYKAAQQRGLRRRRRRRRRGGGGGEAAPQQHRRRRRRQRRRDPGGAGPPQTLPRPSQGSLFSSGEDLDLSPASFPFQAVSYINVGVFHLFDEAGVEVHCGGHPSLELPGYSPRDPELEASYPYCYPLPNEQPPAYEEIYPRQPCANRH